ncbi:fructose-bisphosphate aldolase class I [Candidatus Woesearchaeota archaeon]|nr:fructose-bisphosphate aldolase class I [Candidatus Woesearchaeota archaeon]
MGENLNQIARAVIAPGKGIAALDESTNTIGNRFKEFGIPNTPENRRDYRALLATTPGIEKHIGGVIFYDEAFWQKIDGVPLPAYLLSRGILTIIKVDAGLEPFESSQAEKVTKRTGLDGIEERLGGYRENGAALTKWRAELNVGEGFPTEKCVMANAGLLGEYAERSVKAGLVPIVEPEVVNHGPFDARRTYDASALALEKTFTALKDRRIELKHIILKTSFITPGEKYQPKLSAEEVAELTLGLFRELVPNEVPGIAFLSGGLSDGESAAFLNAASQSDRIDAPWILSFSYGRALQREALKAWGGKAENARRAQEIFAAKAAIYSAASAGRYSPNGI